MRLAVILFLLSVVALPSEVYAADQKKKKEKDKPAPGVFKKAGDRFAKRIDKTAESIDLSLAGKRYTRRPNESSLSISQLSSYTEGGHTRNSADFGVNLRLPNLERRWQLRFSSYDEEEADRDLRQRRVRTAPRQREYGASVFFLRQLGKVKATFQPRLELKDPLEMSYVGRLESVAEMKNFRLRPKLELFADPEKGTGEFFSLEFVRQLTGRLDLVINNEEEYRERGNYFETNHGISLDYALKHDKGLGFSVLFGANNRPTYHLESFTVGPTFAHEYSFRRFKYYVSPFIGFGKAEHFKGKVGVSVNSELTF